jgi:hypothetical protein
MLNPNPDVRSPALNGVPRKGKRIEGKSLFLDILKVQLSELKKKFVGIFSSKKIFSLRLKSEEK